jgi:hypothetical protein
VTLGRVVTPPLAQDLPSSWGFQSAGAGRMFARSDSGAPGAVGTAPGGGAAGDVGSTVTEAAQAVTSLTPYVLFANIIP